MTSEKSFTTRNEISRGLISGNSDNLQTALLQELQSVPEGGALARYFGLNGLTSDQPLDEVIEAASILEKLRDSNSDGTECLHLLEELSDVQYHSPEIINGLRALRRKALPH